MKNRIKFDPTVDYYKIAEVKETATSDEIEKAYDTFWTTANKDKEIFTEAYSRAAKAQNVAELERLSKKLKEVEEHYAKVDHAFKVLIYSREKYDKKRVKTVDTTQNNNFDVTKDYYSILDVERTADSKTIFESYERLTKGIVEDKVLSDDDKDMHLCILLEAYTVLGNPITRKEYDNARALYLKNNNKGNTCTIPQEVKNNPSNNGVRVIHIEDDNDKKTSNKARRILKGILAGVGIAAIGTLIILGVGSLIEKLDNKANTNQPGVEQEDPTYVPDEEKNEIPNVEVVVKGDYCGDINDTKLLNERATVIAKQFAENGFINLNTGKPYTVDEIETIAKVVNGAYIPENTSDTNAQIDNNLILICAVGNSDLAVDTVNYLGGDDSLADKISALKATYKELSLVDNMIFGNCTAKPLLKKIEDNFNKIMASSNREECNRLVEETFQCFVDIECGRGHKINDIVYTKNDLVGLDKINAGNIYMTYAALIQAFRNPLVKDEYPINNGPDICNIDRVLPSLNPLNGLDSSDLGYDDNGNIIIKSNDNGVNTAQVIQINTINSMNQKNNEKNKPNAKVLK